MVWPEVSRDVKRDRDFANGESAKFGVQADDKRERYSGAIVAQQNESNTMNRFMR